MPQNSGTPKPALNERFKSAVITLNVANAAFDIWWFYNSAETRDLDALNEFPTFFRYDSESNFRASIASLYTLYDTHKGTNTLASILNDLLPSKAQPIFDKITSLSEKRKKVTFLRHNVIAHRNAKANYNDLFKQARITPDDIKHVIEETLAILSMIAVEIGEPEPYISTPIKNELSSLMAKIKQH